MAYESPNPEMSLTPFDPFINRMVDELFEKSGTPEYQVYGSELREALHYEREDLFEDGIGRAMHACAELHLPLREHFETVFLCDEHGIGVQRDYRLSRLACYFTTIHVEPINSQVAEAQLFFLRRK